MGHDIEVYDKMKQVAYLRRSMWSGTIHSLYVVLNCKECDGGCSGNGRDKFISLRRLIVAQEWVVITMNEDFEDYYNFLDKCIEYCKKNKKQGVNIKFN